MPGATERWLPVVLRAPLLVSAQRPRVLAAQLRRMPGATERWLPVVLRAPLPVRESRLSRAPTARTSPVRRRSRRPVSTPRTRLSEPQSPALLSAVRLMLGCASLPTGRSTAEARSAAVAADHAVEYRYPAILRRVPRRCPCRSDSSLQGDRDGDEQDR